MMGQWGNEGEKYSLAMLNDDDKGTVDIHTNCGYGNDQILLSIL